MSALINTPDITSTPQPTKPNQVNAENATVMLVAAMSDRMADIQMLLDAAGPSGMDGLPQRLPDLRRLATLLTGMAAGGA